MAMFYCDHFMVDTDCIAAAGMFDGAGPLDGQYLLALILVVGHDEMVNFGATFSTRKEREEVFQALTACKKAAEGCGWEHRPD